MLTVLYTHGEDDSRGGDVGNGSSEFPGSTRDAARGEGGRPVRIAAHAWPLPNTLTQEKLSGVEVLVAGAGRSLPGAKHSSWLRDRRNLDELKAQVCARGYK